MKDYNMPARGDEPAIMALIQERTARENPSWSAYCVSKNEYTNKWFLQLRATAFVTVSQEEMTQARHRCEDQTGKCFQCSRVLASRICQNCETGEKDAAP